MAKAKNKIIAGDYEGQIISVAGKTVYRFKGWKKEPIDRSTVKSYEVMDQERQTSAVSAVGRGALGVFLAGPIGAAAALSAKSKGVHVVAVVFKDGCKSLLEVDDKVFKALTLSLF